MIRNMIAQYLPTYKQATSLRLAEASMPGPDTPFLPHQQSSLGFLLKTIWQSYQGGGRSAEWHYCFATANVRDCVSGQPICGDVMRRYERGAPSYRAMTGDEHEQWLADTQW